MKSKIDVVSLQAINKKIAPHISLASYQGNKLIIKKSYGKSQKIFDIASVTKMVLTTPIIIKAIGEKRLLLSDPVKKFLPVFTMHAIGDLTIKSLLNQTSGLIWWRPYYKKLNKYPLSQRKFIFVKELFKEKPKKNNGVEYSDVNFILLGWVIESIYCQPLDKIFYSQIAKPLKLKNTKFKLGKVNDQNCLSLGGVTGHAGLFSNLDDMAKLGNEFLNTLKGKSKTGMKKNLLLKFAKKNAPGWGLGLMKPSRPVSTGGTKISLNSFGFPGFTGPSLWVDQKRNAFVTILAHRRNPSHKNKKYARVRVALHDLIWEMIDEKK